MENRKSTGNASGMIAAVRRRRIYELALQHGSVSVSELAAELGVADNTIRYDLDALARDGKLVRSHGGAVIKETGLPMPPYSQIRGSNMLEKSWVAAAAIDFLPETGSIFINPGSTTYQLALRIQDQNGLEITTNSPEIATYLAANTRSDINLLGGRMVKESLESDGTLSTDALDRLYWDVAFMGISAIDMDHGITSLNLTCAILENKVMEHSAKVIGLCDSSKLGRFARAKVGELNLLDVFITDKEAKPAAIEALKEQGIEVVLAANENANF